MKNTIQIALTVVAIVLVIDFLGFMAWAMSGQRPVDNFYVGTITTHALQVVIK